MARVVVVGAGVGGLACAVRCAEAGHRVTVLEATGVPGGKAGRRSLDGFSWDTGPSLLTMPWVFRDLLGDECPELMRVEPVTQYRFADGSSVELSADLPRALEALEAWSPGSGDDWARFLGTCAGMWRASVPFLTGHPPFPPRRDVRADPRDALRVKPWWTLRQLARAHARDPRLRMVIERFATYAGADPRRAPAALAVAGYVEHAFGAWHVPGGIFKLVRALVARLEKLGGEVRYGTPATGLVSPDDPRGRSSAPVRFGRPAHATGPVHSAGRGRSSAAARSAAVLTAAGPVPADRVVWNGDALALDRLLGRPRPRLRRERSLSGYVLLLGVRGRTPGLAHHTIAFPRDYDAEFDDVFVARRPVREPTVYVSTSSLTDPGEAPAGDENWFVLVNAPSGVAVDEDAVEEQVLARLAGAGLDPSGRIAVRARRTPRDLEAETGAVGGAIYGDAPHRRLGTLLRPGPLVRGKPWLLRAGGTAHPGGGLPLVALSGALAAREIGPA